MWQSLGHLVRQPSGYKAFIPRPFPLEEVLVLPRHLEVMQGEAMRLIGKLDGISQLLPDKDLFLLMFMRKEAASSSQIEGTQATMTDAIEADVLPRGSVPVLDVADIIFYIRALNYGIARFKTLPLSVRFIWELHEELMTGARSTHNPFPGEFRSTQNWIGGTSPANASFIPPPAHEIPRVMGDLEKFIHTKDGYPPLIKAALLHAQFETIHPFTDGNGRTGRLLVTMFIWQEKLLELPLLYLSDFFKKNQKSYYERLQAYHSDPADVEGWIEFFLEGIIETATSAIKIASEINRIREKDMEKMLVFGRRAETTIKVLRNLYRQPIVNIHTIQEWTNIKTRVGAQKLIDRLIDLEILVQRNPQKTYGKIYEYRSYLRLFQQS